MHATLTYIRIFILCVCCSWMETAHGRIFFSHIGIDDGLSQSTVFGVAQDNNNLIWIATNDGLNRFDGYSFKIYRHNSQQPTSIGSDIIKTVLFDPNGRLWVGSDRYLSGYDAIHDRFQNYAIGAKTSIDHIVSVSPQVLLVVANGRLYEFNTLNRRFSPSRMLRQHSGHITTIYRLRQYIYIGSEDGLYIHDLVTRQTRTVARPELAGKNIQVIVGHDNHLWIGTEGHGLFQVDIHAHRLRHYSTGNSSLCSNYIRALAFDSRHQLWIGTVDGLNILTPTGTFTAYKSNALEAGSLSQASVRCIYPDHQGGVWVGTYFGGLNYYHPRKHRFTNIRCIPGQPLLNNNIISCIVEDQHHKLWIGTNGGINIYTPSRNTFEHVTRAHGLRSNDIKAIHIDTQQGTAYIGAQLGGLSIMNIATRKMKTILSDDKNADANSIYAITPYGQGQHLLLGTLTGLKLYDKKTRTIRPAALSNPRTDADENKVRTIFQDAIQRYWVGTEAGLRVYKSNGDRLQEVTILPKKHPLRHAFIFCIVQDAERQLWIGTRQGAFCVNPANGKTKHLTVDRGLPSNIIYGILQDNRKNMWFSSGYGLCRFTPKTGSIRNYTHTDGLQSNQFTPYAFCKTHDGQLYFGGVNGITSFYPERLTGNPYTPKAVISELKLFNKTVSPHDETGILKQQTAFTKRITLSHSQSMFSLEFVVSNYIAGTHNTFAYMLEGYDQKWHYTQDLRTVTYSRIPHGTYTFKVKAANDDGRWNNEPTTLEIVILPVWYNTWQARILYILLAIALGYFGFRYALSRKVVKLQLEQERQEKIRIQEVNEMKQRFFINVTHELRTPLTLICSPLQELRAHITQDAWAQRQFTLIERNVNRLIHLVNQLMDYRRAELGVFKLQVAQIKLQELVEKIFLQFEQLARQKDVNYQLVSHIDNTDVWCDPYYIELILNNLLSNAFKHTRAGQSITVTIEAETVSDGKLHTLLQVSDTGRGIPKAQQDRIFERFYQIDSSQMGSGVGLSLVQRLVDLHHGTISLVSELGSGSSFTVSLPNAEEAYGNNEKAKDGISSQPYTVNPPGLSIDDNDDMTFAVASELDTDDTDLPHLLIVEDNADIRHHLRDALASQYHIIEAVDGQEAIDIMEDTRVDLVLTDVMMPRTDGLQLCKHIKQHIQTSHIPVVILSAKADVQEQLDGLRIGADDYITKPFSIAIIKAKLQNFMRIRQQAIAHYNKTQEIDPKNIARSELDEKLLQQALDIVNRHIGDTDFSTEIFAREMLMSRSNLHLKLKALTGESANDFVRRIRFNKACQLITEGRYSISEISYLVGFSTPSYFATSFKKRFGCMPTEYGKKS